MSTTKGLKLKCEHEWEPSIQVLQTRSYDIEYCSKCNQYRDPSKKRPKAMGYMDLMPLLFKRFQKDEKEYQKSLDYEYSFPDSEAETLMEKLEFGMEALVPLDLPFDRVGAPSEIVRVTGFSSKLVNGEFRFIVKGRYIP